MTLYWKATTIPVSLFRLWLFNLILPESVQEWWDKREFSLLMELDAARKDLFFARDELRKRESLHEQNWLREASMFSGIDFSHEASLYGRGEYENSALLCAKEAYKRGMGYREFLPFYNQYRGIA